MTRGSARPRRSDPRQAWTLIALVIAASVAFGFFGVPRLAPEERTDEAAPDFVLPVIHGGESGSRIRLSEQRGKTVLLDFWASWCQPCREQARVLESVRSRYPSKRLVIIGVNVSDTPDNAESYLKKAAPPWVVVRDTNGLVDAAYAIEQLPTLVAIDPEGKVVFIRRRFVNQGELTRLLEELLG